MPQRKETSRYGEYGKTGLPVYSGRVYDEIDKKLTDDKWRKIVREMSDTDASIRALLFLIEMIVRQVEWSIVPFEPDNAEDEELAQFVRECLFEDMQQTWPDTVAEILSFVPWGWSWLEIVYKRRGGLSRDKTKNSRFNDNRIGWRKWAIRAQESLHEWKFDEWDEVEAMVQMPEPSFDLCEIPAVKSLHFRASTHKQNPEGRSILRGAYRAWYFKRHIENIEGIGIERDLAGLPLIHADPAIFQKDATADQKAMRQYLQDLGSKIRQDETAYILIPSLYDDKGNNKYGVELLNAAGKRQFDTSGIIDRYDQRMLMAAMADFLLMGSQKVGTYALSETKFRAFLKGLKSWLDGICETVNVNAIPKLLRLNGKTSDRAPYLEAGTLDDISLEQLGTFVDVLVKAGVTFTGEEQQYLKGRANIPVDAKNVPAETEPVDPDAKEDPEKKNGPGKKKDEETEDE